MRQASKRIPESAEKTVRDIADLPTKCVGVNLLLEDAAHPLERCLRGLLTPVGLRDNADHPTGVAEKALRTASRNDRWVDTG
jgi:hypothetical protein